MNPQHALIDTDFSLGGIFGTCVRNTNAPLFVLYYNYFSAVLVTIPMHEISVAAVSDSEDEVTVQVCATIDIYTPFNIEFNITVILTTSDGTGTVFIQVIKIDCNVRTQFQEIKY